MTDISSMLLRDKPVFEDCDAHRNIIDDLRRKRLEHLTDYVQITEEELPQFTKYQDYLEGQLILPMLAHSTFLHRSFKQASLTLSGIPNFAQIAHWHSLLPKNRIVNCAVVAHSLNLYKPLRIKAIMYFLYVAGFTDYLSNLGYVTHKESICDTQYHGMFLPRRIYDYVKKPKITIDLFQ